jgi:hypothetical protein
MINFEEKIKNIDLNNFYGEFHKIMNKACSRYINMKLFKEDDFHYPFLESEYALVKLKYNQFMDQISLSNKELLEKTLELAGGDDYDGCFTLLGRLEYDYYISNLEKRLKACGFLD